MTTSVRIAHLRPLEIRALVVRDGVVSEERVGTDAGALHALVGGPYSFLYLAGGFGDRGLVLVCAVERLRDLAAKRTPPTASSIARRLGTTVAVGPAKLRDGSTAWTSLTDGEVEFWSVALAAPRRRKGGSR